MRNFNDVQDPSRVNEHDYQSRFNDMQDHSRINDYKNDDYQDRESHYHDPSIFDGSSHYHEIDGFQSIEMTDMSGSPVPPPLPSNDQYGNPMPKPKLRRLDS